jgi:predicted nucleotidyltransferase
VSVTIGMAISLSKPIAYIQGWASANSNIKRVWIFGSRIGSIARPDSDLDVAIEANNYPDPARSFQIEWRSQLTFYENLKLDVWEYRPSIDDRLTQAIRDRSLLIYDANNGGPMHQLRINKHVYYNSETEPLRRSLFREVTLPFIPFIGLSVWVGDWLSGPIDRITWSQDNSYFTSAVKDVEIESEAHDVDAFLQFVSLEVSSGWAPCD